MKRNQKISVAVITAILTTAFAFSASAGEGKRKHHKKGDRMEMMAKELNLTDAQKTEMKAIKTAHREEMEKNRTEIKKLKEKMRAQWDQEKPNKKRILELHRKIHHRKGISQEKRIEKRFAMNEVLTPSQRVKAKELKKERHGKRGDRMDRERGECGCKNGHRGGGHGKMKGQKQSKKNQNDAGNAQGRRAKV